MAVLPSADSATDQPCSAGPTAPVPTSFDPGCESDWLAAGTTPSIRKNAASQQSSGRSCQPPVCRRRTLLSLVLAVRGSSLPACARRAGRPDLGSRGSPRVGLLYARRERGGKLSD